MLLGWIYVHIFGGSHFAKSLPSTWHFVETQYSPLVLNWQPQFLTPIPFRHLKMLEIICENLDVQEV
jgi:hypothetical protein